MKPSMKILVVDDEPAIVEALVYTLRQEHYEPLIAVNAEQCMEIAQSEQPDLILLDVMLPSASGFEVCKRLRQFSDVPIIMLTARADETDRVVGLEIGADDYVMKPFSMRELMARIKTVLRRKAPAATAAADNTIRVGNLMIDPSRHHVTLAGEPLELSRKEFELLHYFVTHPNATCSRETLLDAVWGADNVVGERTVDVHIRWLREKIEDDPAMPKRLLTVRGFGYQFRPE
jgi:phosphate regulon transcriptional regulator PhoB